MSDSRVKPSMLVSAFVCCLIIVIAVLGQQQQDNISRKTSGGLSALARATPTPTVPDTITTSTADGVADAPRQNKQRELPPLNFTFRARSGATFPENFTRFMPSGTQAASNTIMDTQVFSVPATSDDPLRLGVDIPEIVAIEIERPKVVGPIILVGPRNLGARKSHHVEEFNTEFPNVNGENVTAAVFDEGGILSTHFEFRLSPQNPNPNRVQVNTTKPLNLHATHVAGTMAATGRKATAKGMAPSLKLVSEDWNGDLQKLAAMAPNIQVSNHSYGPLAGWGQDQFGRWLWWGDRQLNSGEDSKFGKYTSNEAQLDEVLYRFPHLLTFIAAGNDRDDGPPEGSQPIQHYVIEGRDWVVSSEVHRNDGSDEGGLDTVVGLGLAKNAICIGAVDDITTTSGINMVSFSGWGPADDGRIKPDLVANGFHLLSTSSTGDTQYADMSGTSQASPTAAGIASLLVQLYQQVRGGARPSAAEIKAVLIHTAVDAGTPGPDPVFGWGSIDAMMAGRVIGKRLDAQNFRYVLKVDDLTPNQTKDYMLMSNGTNDPIKVTMVWTDPAGEANMRGLDEATPALINDLDVKLINPAGDVIFYPYRLDLANRKAPAKKDGPNRVDNVEVIEPAVTMSGPWKLQVTGTNLRQGPSQRFALVISGLKPM